MSTHRLSDSQKTRLCNVFRTEFTAEQFADFIWLKLQELPNLITTKTHPANIDDVVQWAEDRSRMLEMLRHLQSARPGNSEIDRLWTELQSQVVDVLHDAFPASDRGDLESIVNKSATFEDVGKWLERLAYIRQAVCRIEPQPQNATPESLVGYATGFLIGPSLVLTNFHVANYIQRESKADQTILRFGYEVTPQGNPTPGQRYKLATDWLLAYDDEDQLDYAVLRLAPAPAPSTAQTFLRLVDHDFAMDEPLLILQHPSANPLKLAFGVVVNPADGQRVAYNVNTEPGSSGSPCLTGGLKTVALHHWGGTNHNRGIRLGLILNHLRDTGKANLLESHGGL